MAEQIACTVVEKVIEKVVDSISRQFSYILCYNSNITNLTDGVQDLLNKSAGVQLFVDRAKKNLEVIAPNVEVWLTKVGEIEKKMSEVVEGREKVKNGCLNGWCPNLKQRYLLSRKAVKQTSEIVKLQEEGAGYTQLSYTAPPTSMAASTSTFCYEVFESRISKTKEVIEALKNSKIHKIGICGVGGVGKTKMVKEIRERAIVEHFFDEVVMTVVSQNQDLRKIQDQLASTLKFNINEKGTTYERGIELSKRLAQGRILVIFDDVWEELDFGELGIPIRGEGESKGCKILLTSRDEHVCKKMGTQETFTIQLLSDKEAWDLFKEKAGDLVETRDLHSIAQQLVNECGHLPLAIVTVGTTLKDRDKCAWDDALKQLKMSTPTSIEGMDRKVYSVLRLSYDYLERDQISSRKKGSNEIQQLFLLCCLFPEDYDIPIECLVRYAWGLRQFRNVNSLAEARNRTKSMVGRLTSCFLLLASDHEGYVKMHDVVRDFGLQEATDGNHVYMVRHNAESNEWLQNDTTEPYTAISFGTKEELQLPIGLVCPRIQLLNLAAEGSVQISRRYFEGMEELRVISLQGQFVDFDSEHMLVESPPKAVNFLINVRMLSLESCRIGKNIGLVGSLQKLEILSFYKSDIDVLPSEIGKLINLKLLDLRCNKLGLILPGVLSCLSKLEELYMGLYFVGKGVEERNQGNCASITELCSMSCLKTLQISMSKPELLLKLKDFPFGKLTRFRISKSYMSVFEGFGGYEFRNRVNLEYFDVVSILNTKIGGLMSRTEELVLWKVKGLNNFAKQLDEDGFVNLKKLSISYSDDIIEVFDANLPTRSLGRLEEVELRGLRVMRHLWSGPIQPPSFVNVKSLTINHCPAVTSLFSPSVVGCLVQLKSFRIISCKMLEEIVLKDGAAEDDTRMIEFPNLDSLELTRVPSLKSFVSVSDICSSENNHDKLSLFNEVLLPSMRQLVLEGINMVSIVGAQMRPGSLYKLRDLRLRYCAKIVCVVALEATKQLKNLEKLEAWECDSVETLFDLEGLEEEVMVLGQLVSIELYSLVELRHLWKNVPTRGFQGFQNLANLKVRFCNNLISLFSPSVVGCLVQLKSLVILNCRMLEEIVSKDGAAEDDTRMIEFPNLDCLELSYVQSLKSFVSVSDICSSENNHDKLSLFNEVLLPSMRQLVLEGINMVSIVGAQMRPGSLYKLRDLRVSNCGDIVCVVAFEAIKQLMNLENLEVRFCDSVETLFDLEGLEEEVMVLGQLVSIELNYQVELRHLWKNVPTRGFQGFQNLTTLNVYDCKKLSYLLSPCIAKLLVNLQDMRLWHCEIMERVIQMEEEEEEEDYGEILTEEEDIRRSKTEKKNIIVFPQLRSLKLGGLHNLKVFCHRNHCIEFPSLDDLFIDECPRMKIFLSRSVRAPKLKTLVFNFNSIPVHELNYMMKRQNEAGGQGSDEQPTGK